MSKFTEKQIQEIRSMFKKELGLEVSSEEASKHASQLIDLLRVTYRRDDDELDKSPP